MARFSACRATYAFSSRELFVAVWAAVGAMLGAMVGASCDETSNGEATKTTTSTKSAAAELIVVIRQNNGVAGRRNVGWLLAFLPDDLCFSVCLPCV